MVMIVSCAPPVGALSVCSLCCFRVTSIFGGSIDCRFKAAMLGMKTLNGDKTRTEHLCIAAIVGALSVCYMCSFQMKSEAKDGNDSASGKA